jgi:FKBP12-rapamycin complex-associated protein
VITLALTILGEFDFSGMFLADHRRPEMFTRVVGHVLNEFVRNCALPYLEEDHLEIRKAAALTCCSVFRRDPIGFQGSNNSIEIISDVIDKLLTVGIADPGSSHSVMVANNLIAGVQTQQSGRLFWQIYMNSLTSTWRRRKMSALYSSR